jgi:hypothetical protein
VSAPSWCNFARLHGLAAPDAAAAAERWIERLGLSERAGDRVEALSLGNQQRVQLGVDDQAARGLAGGAGVGGLCVVVRGVRGRTSTAASEGRGFGAAPQTSDGAADRAFDRRSPSIGRKTSSGR